MSKTKKTPTTTIAALLDALKAAGHPRPFTLDELDARNAAAATHDLEGITEKMQLEVTEAMQRDNQRVRLTAAEKAVEALEKQLDAEYERDEWRDDRIESILARLEEKQAERAQLLLDAAPERLAAHRDQERHLATVMRVTDIVNIDTALALTKLEGDATELLQTGTADELAELAELIEGGLEAASPLSRRQRRAALARERRTTKPARGEPA